jgi:hypothetical protein
MRIEEDRHPAVYNWSYIELGNVRVGDIENPRLFRRLLIELVVSLVCCLVSASAWAVLRLRTGAI